MTRILTPIFAAALALSAPMAFAGGPVVVEDATEVVADQPASIGILPIIIIGVVLCAVICGSDDNGGKD